METTLEVPERNDRLLTIRLRKALPDGSYIPYDLTLNPTIDLFVKNSRDDADGSAKFHYTTGAQIVITQNGSTGTYSELTIQCAGADQTPPGKYWFHLDVVRGARRDTVGLGPWFIPNI